MPGKLAPSIAGHVPRELSGYNWYSLQYGGIITAEVKYERPKRLPLAHGRLEILIKMSILWDNAVKIKQKNKKIKEKLETA